MPLTRKTTGVEKTKRETGSIDKVRIMMVVYRY